MQEIKTIFLAIVAGAIVSLPCLLLLAILNLYYV